RPAHQPGFSARSADRDGRDAPVWRGEAVGAVVLLRPRHRAGRRPDARRLGPFPRPRLAPRHRRRGVVAGPDRRPVTGQRRDPAAGGGQAMGEAPVVTLEGVTKTYGGIAALDGVDFDLRPGEIHA